MICFYVLQLDRLTLSIAIRFWMAKTPKQRAKVDLDTHYSQVAVFSVVCRNSIRTTFT